MLVGDRGADGGAGESGRQNRAPHRFVDVYTMFLRVVEITVKELENFVLCVAG